MSVDAVAPAQAQQRLEKFTDRVQTIRAACTKWSSARTR